MGRPSKLTDAQWDELGMRLLNGEKAATLAREYGVPKSAVSVRFSERNRTIAEAAQKLVDAESVVMSLPPKTQMAVRTMAEKLMSISQHVASAAEYGAATAHRLAGIANAKVQEVDDSKPLDDDSREALKDVAVLTKMANDAGALAVNLLSANKERVTRVVDMAEVIENEPGNLREMPVLDAAKAYSDFVSG